MKKYLSLVVLMFLFSCSWKKTVPIEEAKKELLSWEKINIEIDNDLDINDEKEKEDNYKNDDIILEQDNFENEESFYEVNYLYWEWEIEVMDLQNILNIKDELIVSWKVYNTSIDKITVFYKNESSNFPEDFHTLQKFKQWNSTFEYNAFRRFKVLDYWKNIYNIKAYSWDNIISEAELVFFLFKKENISEKQESNINIVEKNIWLSDDNIYISLPENDIYWTPIMMWTSWFTYSLLNNFESKKNIDLFDIDCNNLTDYVINNFSWAYWNTCRPIWDFIISFYILHLKWDEYFYEKHYLDKKYWLYWIQLLEKWSWINKDNIESENSILRNKTYEIVEKTDKLYLDIFKLNQ